MLPDGNGLDFMDGLRQKRETDALADVLWALLNSGEFFLNH